MSAAWLAPPLDLKTVCVRLKAAVEERETFYRMTPSVAAEPLEIPDAPFPLGVVDRNFPRAFADNLAMRIALLVENSYDPRNFGNWCGYRTFANTAGWMQSDPDWPGFEAFGIDGAAFCRRRPYRWTDRGGFFTAAAEVLDRIALYPDPPRFSSARGRNSGRVFGIDADLSVTDLVNGNSDRRRYQPTGGDLRIALAGGGQAICFVETARNWRKDVSDAAADNWSIYYDASVGQAGTANRRGEGVPLRGEFTFRLSARLSVTGRATESFTQELTVRPGGVCDAPDFSCWREYFTPASGSDRWEAVINFDSDEIRLRPENYPPLPYRYFDQERE